jgi:hypothetical protein
MGTRAWTNGDLSVRAGDVDAALPLGSAEVIVRLYMIAAGG